jgi:hypothetical protein
MSNPTQPNPAGYIEGLSLRSQQVYIRNYSLHPEAVFSTHILVMLWRPGVDWELYSNWNKIIKCSKMAAFSVYRRVVS